MKSKVRIIRKLVMSIFSVVLLTLSITTSTFAWFQINSVGTITGFDFTAVSGLGFKVSIDNKVYSNDLSSDQMKMAILNSYDPEKYVLRTVLNDDNKYEQFIEVDEEKYINNKPVIEKIKLSSYQMSSEIKKNIQLLPLTSKTGIVMKDLYNSESKPENGRFVKFNVYFKHESLNKDDKPISIYVSGNERTEIDGVTRYPTEIKSDVGMVRLLTTMVTNDKTYKKNDEISVYSVNALRYSIEDTINTNKIRKMYPDQTDSDLVDNGLLKATIYEPSNEYNLGSYATDYGIRNNEDDNNDKLLKLYKATTNASFTYYNNLKPFSPVSALNYDSKPETIMSLVDEQGNDRIDLPPVTTVYPDEQSNLVTFRFWLEGWDADCFDGLAKSINVKLSFRSEYVNDNK